MLGYRRLRNYKFKRKIQKLRFRNIEVYILNTYYPAKLPFCILALGSGQRLLYRLGSGLVLVLVLVTV